MRSRFNAVIDEDVLLKYNFIKNGQLADIYQWNKVEIYNVDPRDNPTASPIQTIYPIDITRLSIGLYEYKMNFVNTAGVYFDKQYYIPAAGYPERSDVEQVVINESATTSFSPPCLDKVGYFFGNYVVPPGEWGVIATPDDLRYHVLWGIELVSTNGMEINDYQLTFAIDAALREVERYLDIDIRKRVYKCNPASSLISKPLWKEGVDYTNEEDVYPFRPDAWRNYGFFQLRHRPVISIERMKLYSVVHSELFDLLRNNWVRPEKEAGQLYVFPTKENFPYGPPMMASLGGGWLWLQGTKDQYPGAFEIDYTTGYKDSDWVDAQLRDFIVKLAAVNILGWMGDGLMAGFSSSSVSIDGLSESFSSTQSPENTYFGARIRQYLEEIKVAKKELRFKFANIPISFM